MNAKRSIEGKIKGKNKIKESCKKNSIGKKHVDILSVLLVIQLFLNSFRSYQKKSFCQVFIDKRVMFFDVV